MTGTLSVVIPAYNEERFIGTLLERVKAVDLSTLGFGVEIITVDDLAGLRLETSGFELAHEITARLLARGKSIAEVPIRYYPRSREQGKKIGPRDWFIGARTLWRYRNG